MMELTLAILNRMSFVALTALLQSILILGLACLVAKLMHRRHAVCHAICFGAILSCLICPVLAYSVMSVGFVSPCSYRIADAESIDSDFDPRPRIVTDESFDDINRDSFSEPRSSKTDPGLTPDEQNLESKELASAVATLLAESKDVSGAEIRPLTSELSHPALQSAGSTRWRQAPFWKRMNTDPTV